MQTTDEYPYDPPSETNKARYDWENYVITSGVKVEEINFGRLVSDLSEEERILYSKFIHEYTHYLQNFSTNWGTHIINGLLHSFSNFKL